MQRASLGFQGCLAHCLFASITRRIILIGSNRGNSLLMSSGMVRSRTWLTNTVIFRDEVVAQREPEELKRRI